MWVSPRAELAGGQRGHPARKQGGGIRKKKQWKRASCWSGHCRGQLQNQQECFSNIHPMSVQFLREAEARTGFDVQEINRGNACERKWARSQRGRERIRPQLGSDRGQRGGVVGGKALDCSAVLGVLGKGQWVVLEPSVIRGVSRLPHLGLFCCVLMS